MTRHTDRILSTVILLATLCLVVIAFMVGAVSLASGNDNPGVCPGTHITPPDGTTTVTVTAPEGFLIAGYCVKAGSIEQDLGPESFVVDPPAASVTFSHSSGKDISHYSLVLVPITPDTTAATTSTVLDPTTTTVPVDTTQATTTVPAPSTTMSAPPPPPAETAPPPVSVPSSLPVTR